MGELLTSRELALRLRVSEKTLANWRVQGRGPRYAKIGSCVRYPAAAVDEWVESNIRRNTDATEGTIRQMEHQVLGKRTRIHGAHRFGRHRTQSDTSATDRGGIAKTSAGGKATHAQIKGEIVQ